MTYISKKLFHKLSYVLAINQLILSTTQKDLHHHSWKHHRGQIDNVIRDWFLLIILLWLLLNRQNVVSADLSDFGWLGFDEIEVKYSIENCSCPLPFWAFTKRETFSSQPGINLGHSSLFGILVMLIYRVEILDEIDIDKF